MIKLGSMWTWDYICFLLDFVIVALLFSYVVLLFG